MKKISMIISTFCFGVVACASEVKLGLSGTIVNPDPTMTMSSYAWALGTLKVGDAINSTISPVITLKAPNTTIETVGTLVQLKFEATKTLTVNWRGGSKLTVEEAVQKVVATEIPLGGTLIFPVTLKPTTAGITVTPKFILTGTANSAGAIAETIIITATYI